MGIGVLLVIGIIAASSVIFAILGPSQMEPLPAYSVGFWFFTVVTAAFTEETLYRAYPNQTAGGADRQCMARCDDHFCTVRDCTYIMGTNGVVEILFVIAPIAAVLTGLYLRKRNFFLVVIRGGPRKSDRVLRWFQTSRWRNRNHEKAAEVFG